MKLREALIQQAPSLALQRAAADEIARMDALIEEMRKAMVLVEEVLGIEGYFDGGPTRSAVIECIAAANNHMESK
jgi:DNA-binding FadR family transcriptional regulator